MEIKFCLTEDQVYLLKEIIGDAKKEADARVLLMDKHVKKTVPFEAKFLEHLEERAKKIGKLIDFLDKLQQEGEKEKSDKKFRCQDCAKFYMERMRNGVFQYRCDDGRTVDNPKAPACCAYLDYGERNKSDESDKSDESNKFETPSFCVGCKYTKDGLCKLGKAPRLKSPATPLSIVCLDYEKK